MTAKTSEGLLTDLFKFTAIAVKNLAKLEQSAREVVRARVSTGSKPDPATMQAEQRAVHGLAWVATYVCALRELDRWARRLQEEGSLTTTEQWIVQIGFGEYLNHIVGGLPMSQSETLRLTDLDLGDEVTRLREVPAIAALLKDGNSVQARASLAEITRTRGRGLLEEPGQDETLTAMREEMARFAAVEVTPYAHELHLNNDYIPLELVEKIAELGVFGLTVPEAYGGLGLGKEAMCVVSEELSRAWIAVGSLGTRSEIAAELILSGGTDEQKTAFLPKIASGEILPTAVFTEPNTGSDLASLRTRAEKIGGNYQVTGNKTWITHPVRADLMTLLVRTNPDDKGHRGLSMLLAEKPRGSDDDPFPAEGMSGGEIEVLGYRGMKEYEIAFDGFAVPGGNLLGGVEGQGFKQLMQTFESARIQTAARAVGVAQSALDLGLAYADERVQFGQKLNAFPRVADKLVMMAVETCIARQITYFAAREKDEDRRCDLEAGMAKLLAARIAWANADSALQIHGGNGFALEYPISRVLCDARILNIFEGAAEIQAQVISRRLLESN